MTQLIMFHGLARVGKDTGADFVQEFMSHYGKTADRLAFADPIKEIASIMFSMSREEIEANKEKVIDWVGVSPRHFLQQFGTEFVRNNIDENFWVKHAKYSLEKSKADVLCITDCRFPNELVFGKEVDAITIKVLRDNRDSISETATQHASEVGLPDRMFDYVVDNNGSLNDYSAKIFNILEERGLLD